MPKLRPFCEIFEREPGAPFLKMGGTPRGSAFIVEVLGTELVLPAETGADAEGPYALVETQRLELAGGFALSLVRESVLPFLDVTDTAAARLMFHEAGGTSAQYVGRSFTVHFDVQGRVSGTSCHLL